MARAPSAGAGGGATRGRAADARAHPREGRRSASRARRASASTDCVRPRTRATPRVSTSRPHNSCLPWWQCAPACGRAQRRCVRGRRSSGSRRRGAAPRTCRMRWRARCSITSASRTAGSHMAAPSTRRCSRGSRRSGRSRHLMSSCRCQLTGRCRGTLANTGPSKEAMEAEVGLYLRRCSPYSRSRASPPIPQ